MIGCEVQVVMKGKVIPTLRVFKGIVIIDYYKRVWVTCDDNHQVHWLSTHAVDKIDRVTLVWNACFQHGIKYVFNNVAFAYTQQF